MFATQWSNHVSVEVVLRFDPTKVVANVTANVEGTGTQSTCDEKKSSQVTFNVLLSTGTDEPSYGTVKVTIR